MFRKSVVFVESWGCVNEIWIFVFGLNNVVWFICFNIIDVNFCVINNNCICFVLKGLKFN